MSRLQRTPKPRTIVALVEDRPGALNRLVSKCRQRGFTIESFTMRRSEMPGLFRVVFEVRADTDPDQVVKQLSKLIEVVDIRDVTSVDTVTREMALIKVCCDRSQYGYITAIADTFQASILDASPGSVIVEVTGDARKIDTMVNLLDIYGVTEVVRTGPIAMTRGPQPAHEWPESDAFARVPARVSRSQHSAAD